jgi:hypothetical protein
VTHRAPETWSAANQRLLTLELARVRAAIDGDAAADDAEARIAEARERMPSPPALDVLVEAFALTAFERDVLLACAGAEMDAAFAPAFAKASGLDQPSFGLALSALAEPHWSALTHERPLRRLHLIDVEPHPSLVAARLRIDERVLHFLAGINALDRRLESVVTPREPDAWLAHGHESTADAIARMWEAPTTPPAIAHLAADDPSGAEGVAAAAAWRLGFRLHAVGAADLPTAAADAETFLALWTREAALLPSALLITSGDDGLGDRTLRLVDRIPGPILLACRDTPRLRRSVVTYEVERPDAAEERRLWTLALGDLATGVLPSVDAVASQFRLGAHGIALAARSVAARVDAGDAPADALRTVARTRARQRLDGLAQRVVPAASWGDLILPEAQLAVLRQIAGQVRYRSRVYDEWGLGRAAARGLGIAVLFHGGSGTGKTLAAEVLAAELDLDLYRIDLSAVVSKYIGETEKNLRRVFDAAEDSGAVLLFDEADALFGRRSEVRDSHDRYANIEIGYLLQRMEQYRGLAILTTNLKSALDAAFQRRLRFVVHFPFPDAAEREAIWRLTLPPTMPRDGLDYARLAQLNVTGGGVRNIAVNAAFMAAETNEPVRMRHLLAAAHAESAKSERPLGQAETRGWV